MPEARSELARALAEFHKTMPDVSKGSTNPHFGSKYADLADIVKVVLPALAAQGLAWITTPTMVDDSFVLRYELRHVSGESVEGQWPLPDPTKAKAQELGSAVTYAKRYTLSAVTGIAPDADDDGNSASAKSAPASARRPKVTPDQALGALQQVATLTDLADWWGKVQDYGLAGLAPIKTAHEKRKTELAGTEAPATVDDWAVKEIPNGDSK